QAPPSTVSFPLSLHDALPIYRTGSTPCTPPAVGRLTARRSKDRERAIESRTEAGRRRPPSARRGVPNLDADAALLRGGRQTGYPDRKSTRLNSSHEWISYAVF